MQRIDADSLLWNWARWCHSGSRVGNMEDYIPYDDERDRSLQMEQAEAIEEMHQQLSHAHRMVIIAEYPQRKSRFAGLSSRIRSERARHWIYEATIITPPNYQGVWLRDFEYKRILDLFKQQVEERFL